MRFYLKKVTQWIVGSCFLVILLLNLYHKDIWVYEEDSRSLPWGPDFKRVDSKAPVLRFDGPVVHDHIIRDSVIIPSQTRVYYNKEHDDEDRIVNQLKYIPESVKKAKLKGKEAATKKILLYHGFSGWDIKRGRETFADQKCAVQNCELLDNRQEGISADAILFSHSPSRPWFERPAGQIWILFLLESPYHTSSLAGFGHMYNWTATYRHDSTIVAPYEKFVPYNASELVKHQDKDYAKGKTKKVAWFVSNCGARNGRRDVAEELAKYIQVDIYGACGSLKCPRYQNSKCFDMLNKDYKFYLAFENSNCRDYITEKFFVNGLQNDVIPIVMGGAPVDYRRAAPYHSHIHIDDFESPKALAEYLMKLDNNDNLYNEYFRWKGTGSFVNTFFWCRICSMLHGAAEQPSSSYHDLEKWWRGPGVCIDKDSWRNRSMILS